MSETEFIVGPLTSCSILAYIAQSDERATEEMLEEFEALRWAAICQRMSAGEINAIWDNSLENAFGNIIAWSKIIWKYDKVIEALRSEISRQLNIGAAPDGNDKI